MSDSFTDGRYVLSWTDAVGTRDPIALTQQVKQMRDGFELVGHTPTLVLLVVASGEQDAAVERIKTALNGELLTSERPTDGASDA